MEWELTSVGGNFSNYSRLHDDEESHYVVGTSDELANVMQANTERGERYTSSTTQGDGRREEGTRGTVLEKREKRCDIVTLRWADLFRLVRIFPWPSFDSHTRREIRTGDDEQGKPGRRIMNSTNKIML